MSSRTSLQNSPADFTDSLLNKSKKSEKIFMNNDKSELLNENREIVSTSSYKFLSWREKDRRRRFRDEWKHMWLVIPHGNFEVMCLVCHKVMTQRKLDTIKRHTVRRHTEIIDMDQGKRILLFEKLFLEHNSIKFQAKSNNNNNNGLSDSTTDNGKPDSEVIDLEKLLSSDCVSASSSSSLSPSVSRQSKGDIKYFSKRGKYSRKNIKVNVKSNQKIDSVKILKTSVENKSVLNKNSFKSNVTVSQVLDNKSFNVWSTTNNTDRLLPPSNKTLQDSYFNKLNGSSCLNILPPMPVMSKCPLCLEDCSQNGTDINNAFTRLLTHIQQKHSDKFPGSIPSFDLNHFGGASANDLAKLQALLLPPAANNSNYMSISNAISNVNFISLLYYQELLRQSMTGSHSPSQYGSVSSDSMYYHPTSVSSNSSMFSLFSSHSPQCSLRPTSSIPSSFILPTISDPTRLERSEHISNNFDDTVSGLDKFLTFKRTKFSTESLISEANKQSAFYNPKPTRIEERDVNYNTVTKLPLGSSTYTTTNEPSNFICKENKILKEESYLNEVPINDPNTTMFRKALYDQNIERSLSPRSAAQGNLTCHALRFGPGQDLKDGLLEYMKKKKISAAFIMTCCGSLSRAQLRMADSGVPNTSLEIKNLNKHFEIVSLVGSIFDNGCHLHISLSDCNGDVVGGHVAGDLIVHTTAEVMVGQICGVRMSREFDESTGYPELSFSSLNNI